VTAEDEGPPKEGGPARLLAGLAFMYALVVIVALLPLKDLYRDDPDREAVLLWLLVPLVSSFGSWVAVRSGFTLLRAWLWVGILATAFFCWIAAFSFGLLFLPVPVLMMVAAVSPWDKPRH
jgi:cellulose synthase/poly-beta-1,6-N-acetylglucosamine synthase-like glycosyltransferase